MDINDPFTWGPIIAVEKITWPIPILLFLGCIPGYFSRLSDAGENPAIFSGTTPKDDAGWTLERIIELASWKHAVLRWGTTKDMICPAKVLAETRHIC